MTTIDSHRLTAAALSRGLKIRRIGRHIIVLPEVDSTNTYALDRIAQEEGEGADGTVVFAERQTAGRGRLGRRWESPAGASLLLTALIWARDGGRRPAYWIMAASVAVARAVEALTDVSPAIRWPNDLYVAEAKLAGILVEIRGHRWAPAPAGNGADAVAIGVGVNCLQQAAHFSDELRQKAISLEMASSRPVDRLAVGRAIVVELDRWLSTEDSAPDETLAAAWCEYSGDIGRRATLVSGGTSFTGRIVDVHPEQGLVLQPDTGARRHFDPMTASRR